MEALVYSPLGDQISVRHVTSPSQGLSSNKREEPGNEVAVGGVTEITVDLFLWMLSFPNGLAHEKSRFAKPVGKGK